MISDCFFFLRSFFGFSTVIHPSPSKSSTSSIGVTTATALEAFLGFLTSTGTSATDLTFNSCLRGLTTAFGLAALPLATPLEDLVLETVALILLLFCLVLVGPSLRRANEEAGSVFDVDLNPKAYTRRQRPMTATTGKMYRKFMSDKRTP